MNIDWSKAPEGATGHAQIILEGTIYNLWIFNEEYAYTDRPEDRYTFGGEDRSVRFLNKREELQNICSRPSPTPWTGEGLPPVGTVCTIECEAPHKRWKKHVGQQVTIIAHSTGHEGNPTAVYKVFEAENSEYHALREQVFRPIRIAEQIAAEEREKGITQIEKDCDVFYSTAATIYDAGYRKQEPSQ